MLFDFPSIPNGLSNLDENGDKESPQNIVGFSVLAEYDKLQKESAVDRNRRHLFALIFNSRYRSARYLVPGSSGRKHRE
jgi:hypothetical protein